MASYDWMILVCVNDRKPKIGGKRRKGSKDRAILITINIIF